MHLPNLSFLARAAAMLALSLIALRAQTLTWTQRNTGVAAGLQYTAATYGAGKYAVVAYGSGATSGTFQSQVATSADGVTWSVTTLPTGPVVRGITHGGGLFVVPAERNGADSGNTQNILTSPDGTLWTARTTGAGSLWKVAHTTTTAGANLFVAGGLTSNSPAGSNLAYSADAITWTRTNVGGANARINHLAAGGGIVIAATQDGGQIHRSTDGATWTTVTIPQTIASNFIIGLTYAGGEFTLAVQADGGAARLYSSANGTTWTALGRASPVTPATVTLTSLGASGAASAGARVMVAGNSTNFTTFDSTPYVFHTTGDLTTWTAQQFGSGDFASHNFAFFANNLWLVGNNKTQLFTTTDPAGGTTSGGSTGGSTGGGTGGTGGSTGGSTGGGSAGAYLSNLSIRTTAGADAQTLIVGFNIGGAGTSGTKNLLIRGIGPALTGFGVSGALGDPRLEIFAGSTSVAVNDNWDAATTPLTTQTGTGAFPLATGSRDAALIRSNAAAGSYTVQITGSAGATGTALAEIYDLTPSSGFTAATPRLANISARTQVGAGNDILITGFNVSGTGTRRLLIRGVGPTLGAFGVTGMLNDPKLEIYNAANTLVAANDNWDATATPNSTQTAAGGFALNAGSRDAAVIVNLAPGTYTAQVSGVGGTTGVGLVEIYELP